MRTLVKNIGDAHESRLCHGILLKNQPLCREPPTRPVLNRGRCREWLWCDLSHPVVASLCFDAQTKIATFEEVVWKQVRGLGEKKENKNLNPNPKTLNAGPWRVKKT